MARYEMKLWHLEEERLVNTVWVTCVNGIGQIEQREKKNVWEGGLSEAKVMEWLGNGVKVDSWVKEKEVETQEMQGCIERRGEEKGDAGWGKSMERRVQGDSEHNAYWEQPFSQPYFDNSTRREVTTTVGQTAHLHCRVRNLGDRAVSWIRKRDLHILTVGILTYTNDQRFQSLHTDGSDEWTLKVTSPQTRDSGIYECQVSTEPKISQAFKLNVVVSKAKILGNSELYIKSGSDINLTCIVLQTPDPPSFIYWYRGGNVINYSQRGGISVVTEKQTRTSRLLISRALPSDSGNYTCSPSSSDAASVLVHVLNGEQPAAMQHGNNSSSAICWTIDFVLLFLVQCFILERRINPPTQ